MLKNRFFSAPFAPFSPLLLLTFLRGRTKNYSPPGASPSEAANKSGRRFRVRSKACSIRQAAIRAWSPLSNTWGTFIPLYSAGRVYTGGESNPSWKLSERADCSSPSTPGMSRTMLSATSAAGSSPPETT